MIRVVAATLLASFFGQAASADETELPNAKPIPAVQAIPLAGDQISFTFQDRELARYHFAKSQERPFWFPAVGPTGHYLTRIGHPHDPESHSHHNSIWISHKSVGCVSFWEDRGTPPPGRIVQQRIEKIEDGDNAASLTVANSWQSADGKPVLLERRRMEVRPLGKGDWMLALDLEWKTPGKAPVELGATPFGPIGVRMAKTIGMNDGGGRVLNSEGKTAVPELFRKPARWVDYSGPVSNDQRGGIALFDHPENPGHPSPFHVREDGWMGICLTLDQPRTIEPEKPMRLRYGLWFHDGVPRTADVEERWQAFAK